MREIRACTKRPQDAELLDASNIRELVKLLDEEMDGAAHEERERLETIEADLPRFG